MPFATAAAVYVANLAWAAGQAQAAGVKLVVEPINHRDMPGFHLNTMAQAAAVVAAIGADRLGLQFDIYHCQVTEGDLTRGIEAYLPIIAHMQLADVPGRHEPVPARSAGSMCSAASIRSAIVAGWAASTAPPATR